MKGKIEAVSHKTTKAGKPYVTYKINGVWYSDFENSNFPKDMEVNFEFREKGDFKNITKITQADPFSTAESIVTFPGQQPKPKKEEFPMDVALKKSKAIVEENMADIKPVDASVVFTGIVNMAIAIYKYKNWNGI